MTGRGTAGTPAGSVVPPGMAPEELDVAAVPAGWWVRMPGGAAPTPDDPAYAALPHPKAAITVIVGAPGAPTPSAGDVAVLLASLPDGQRGDVVVSIYGGGPEGEPSLPQRLADLTGRPVLAQHGLLLVGADGERHVAAVDADRGPPWRPFAQCSLYRPGLPPRLERRGEPAPGLEGLGAGGYRLTDGWFVQVVPAGLVLRRRGRPVDPTAGTAPFDPVRLDLRIDHPVAELTDAVLTALGRLADALPAPTRSRLRVVLPHGTTDAEALRVRWAVPAPQQVSGQGRGVRVAPPGVPATLLVITAQGEMRLVRPRGGREWEQDREALPGSVD